MTNKRHWKATGDLKKSFWRLILLSAFIGVVYQATSIWMQYFSYSVVVSQTLINHRQPVFPAVTFCNMNPVRRSALVSFPQLSNATWQQKRRRRLAELPNDVTTRDQSKTDSIDPVHTRAVANETFVQSESAGYVKGPEKMLVLSRHKRATCSSLYYNSLTGLYYCFFLYNSPNPSTKYTRAQAKTVCASMGATLPHIDSWATWNFTTNSIPFTLSTGYFWLDISWPRAATGWLYDDNTPVTWTAWLSYDNTTDQYVVQNLKSPWLWYGDVSNSGITGTTVYALCQLEVDPNATTTVKTTLPTTYMSKDTTLFVSKATTTAYIPTATTTSAPATTAVYYGLCKTPLFFNNLTNSYCCYYFKSATRVTRSKAATDCSGPGLSLPHVDSWATWNFITKSITAPPSGTTGYFWIDIQWPRTALSWIYDNGNPVTWTIWNTMQSTDLYAAQNIKSTWKWYGDVSSSITAAFELCQLEVAFTTFALTTTPQATTTISTAPDLTTAADFTTATDTTTASNAQLITVADTTTVSTARLTTVADITTVADTTTTTTAYLTTLSDTTTASTAQLTTVTHTTTVADASIATTVTDTTAATTAPLTTDADITTTTTAYLTTLSDTTTASTAQLTTVTHTTTVADATIATTVADTTTATTAYLTTLPDTTTASTAQLTTVTHTTTVAVATIATTVADTTTATTAYLTTLPDTTTASTAQLTTVTHTTTVADATIATTVTDTTAATTAPLTTDADITTATTAYLTTLPDTTTASTAQLTTGTHTTTVAGATIATTVADTTAATTAYLTTLPDTTTASTTHFTMVADITTVADTTAAKTASLTTVADTTTATTAPLTIALDTKTVSTPHITTSALTAQLTTAADTTTVLLTTQKVTTTLLTTPISSGVAITAVQGSSTNTATTAQSTTASNLSTASVATTSSITSQEAISQSEQSTTSSTTAVTDSSVTTTDVAVTDSSVTTIVVAVIDSSVTTTDVVMTASLSTAATTWLPTATLLMSTTAAITNAETNNLTALTTLSTQASTQEPNSTGPVGPSATIKSLATNSKTSSSPATTTRRTTVSTTTPQPGAPPPTPAPLIGSSIPGRVAQSQETQKHQQLIQTLASSQLDIKTQIGYQATDFLLDCQYAGYNCDPRSDFYQFYNNVHGNCFVFNSGWNSSLPLLNTSRSGSRFALKVTINIDQDEYITTGNEAAGARVVIHDQADMPFPEDVGILAKAGMLTSVHVSRADIKRMQAPYGTCIDADSAPPDMDVFTELYPVKYDHIGCYKTCYQHHMIHMCHCADASLPNAGAALYNGSFPVCDLTNMTQNDCNYNITQQFVQNQLPCNCPIACDQVQYLAYVTQSHWPTKVNKNSTLQKLGPKIPHVFNHLSDDPNKYKRNLLVVEIYFDNFNFVSIVESAAYSMETVWSNLGGTLGALLGIAFMSFFEVFDLVIDYFSFALFMVFFKQKLNRNTDLM